MQVLPLVMESISRPESRVAPEQITRADSAKEERVTVMQASLAR